ncbi:MAG: DUF2905 domain-containing protein [Ferruginibacter sp.]
MNNTTKYIILAGLFLVVAGLVLHFFPNAFKWFGRLPGDVRIEKENGHFYFPVVSMVLISVVVTILINVFRYLFK